MDHEAIEDFYYRADQTLAHVGKLITVALYSAATGTPQNISRSYFIGCSGGGRDALIAASFFPEEFDGIVAGSPYAEMAGAGFQMTGVTLAGLRSPGVKVIPAMLKKMDPIVKAKCDGLDGVTDGLIQNPAACDFLPKRDLPLCDGAVNDDNCFTKAQVETISALITAVTDEHGKVVQPGFTVSELQANANLSVPIKDPNDPDLIRNGASLSMDPWALGDTALKIFAHGNDPGFHSRSLIKFGSGEGRSITNFHIIVPSREVDYVSAATYKGVGAHPEKMGTLIREKRKLLIWANLSDTILTPYYYLC